MPEEDATLDQFADAGSGKSDAEASDAEQTSDDEPTADPEASTAGEPATQSDQAEAPDEAPTDPGEPVDPGEAADPAEATYRWTGAGARCDGCGAHVQRLWRGDSGLVCGDCKEW